MADNLSVQQNVEVAVHAVQNTPFQSASVEVTHSAQQHPRLSVPEIVRMQAREMSDLWHV